jgi:DNA-binding Lrp family transcriptional regulator
MKIMKLDGIDKQILKALFSNGRESLTNLEKVIFKTETETMSHTGIAKRIAKLEDSGILKVQANTNIDNLQYKALFLLMEMQNFEEVQNIIKAYGPTNKKGILHTASIFVSDLILPKFMPLNLFSGISKENECGNVCGDCGAYLDGKCDGCGKF